MMVEDGTADATKRYIFIETMFSVMLSLLLFYYYAIDILVVVGFFHIK